MLIADSCCQILLRLTDLRPWLPSRLALAGPPGWAAPLGGAAVLTEAPGECREAFPSSLNRPDRSAPG